MKIFAVVAEFNPFHNGHKYLLDKVRMLYPDAVFVAVMSGSFTQRGETAIFNKWQRAKLAVLGGVDLIIELPAVFALRSAEGFANGAISLFDKLGCADMLCCGSENNDTEILTTAANILNNTLTTSVLREKIKKGLNYAAAVDEILTEQLPQKTFSLKEPNMILTIEYLRAIKKLNANLNTVIIKRTHTHHNDTAFAGEFSSASALRRLLKNDKDHFSKIKQSIPAACYHYLRNINQSDSISSTDKLSRIIIGKLRSESLNELRQFSGVNNGLDFKILQAASHSDNLNTLIDNIKSKNFHRSRLQRTLLHILLNITKNDLYEFDQTGPTYARILAFNNNGRIILRHLKNTSSIPIILKTTNSISQKQFWQRSKLTPMQKMLAYDILSCDIHALSYAHIHPSGSDFFTSPIYIP
ncbi:nucleotidyltransferase [Pectinatus frisingensis]|uniref:nucleotidyltransferase n=1 Tax=Pectinatus frisingensis TaxID=865 RepID=UPI0015F3C259|nr:nucleotidyltransferase [Pectinatus frisingensis]